jgi:hypothetical protein
MGLGKPMDGMTSREIRGDGSKGKREKTGLARVGAGKYSFLFWGSPLGKFGEIVLIEVG